MDNSNLIKMRAFFSDEKRFCITLTEEMLGMASGDPKLHETYIASKAPDALSRAEEVEALGEQEVIEKGRTIFPKDENGNPFMWNYQIKGFLKDAVKAMRNTKSRKLKSASLTNYKGKIDKNVIIMPRKIPLIFEGEIGDCQRPLRADTMQGPRTAIADSETVPAGTQLVFHVGVMMPEMMDVVNECMDYGIINGLGGWRNSGKGTFDYEEIPFKPDDPDIIEELTK